LFDPARCGTFSCSTTLLQSRYSHGIATAAPIEVAVGSFTGYHYRIGTETTVEADLYGAPGVGLAIMESPLYDFEHNPFRMVRSGNQRVELMSATPSLPPR
jgi:hypothetical protein